MRLLIILLLTFIAYLKAEAQYSSNNGQFSVNYVKGCASMVVKLNEDDCSGGANTCVASIVDKATGLKVYEGAILDEGLLSFPNSGNFTLTVTHSTSSTDKIDIFVTPNVAPPLDVALCSGGQVLAKVNAGNYPFYIFRFDNDPTTDVEFPANGASTTYTFALPPASHTVSVRGYNGDFSGFPTSDNCTPTDVVVNIAPLAVTSISKLEVLEPTSIQLEYNVQPNVQYKLAAATNAASGFSPVKTILNPTLPATETIFNLRTDDNYYCFRLDTYNACTNTLAEKSTVVCSTNFDAVAQNNQNQLTWATAPSSATTHPSLSYTLYKEGVAQAPNLTTNKFSFTDTDIICNQDTTYQLIINYPSNAQSISLIKSVTSFSSDIPTTTENITATVTEGGLVELSWLQDPAFTPLVYTITKNSNGNFATIGTSATQTFSDVDYNTETPVCYIISYRDVCLNESDDSNEACPIQLHASVLSNNSIQLNWNDYTGWKNGVQQYSIEKYSAAGTLLNTYTSNTTSILDDDEDFLNQVYTYIIYAIANDGTLPLAASNSVTVIKEPNLFYPSAFTPNTDALNDTFTVFGQYLTSIELRIFNRWGELLYTTNSLEDKGWNGIYRGALQPEAAYVFTATLKDQAGRTFERSGSFYLLRKK